MNKAAADPDFQQKLKGLMSFRALFATLLLGSTIILQIGRTEDMPPSRPIQLLYGLIIAIFILSLFYTLVLKRIQRQTLFAYIQVGIDTFIVTLILFMTGGFSSLFSFLYLVVIIYASMLLFSRGSMVMAVLSSIQYGILVDLEYYGLIRPYGIEQSLANLNIPSYQVLFKIVIIMVACFVVAFLSGILSEQERKTKKELKAMAERVQRMERLAAAGEMAAGLAHEIKNPLASLRGSIQLLQEEIPVNSNRGRLMRIVLREADRLGTLVNDFLLFARPPAGNRIPIELNQTLTEIVELFKQDTQCSGRINIEKDTIGEVWVEMDPAHLRQIIFNLLINSAQAIEDTGRIRIGLEPLKNKKVAVRITDTGRGIPDDILPSIYNPFFTTKPTGTGLGLAIVQRIVDSYDSWLEAESEEGKGTTFTLRLPTIPPPAGKRNAL
jgi:two-component system sensor histidine kinase PilS (NtrC family)